MELLTHNWSLSKKLRVPAISRLQKMHNVEVALRVLADRGVQIKNERGKWLNYRFWRLIFFFSETFTFPF